MQSILGEIFLEAEAPGSSVTTRSGGASGRVRHFFCNTADHKKVENFLKMSVTDATLRDAVEKSVATALPWIYKAIAALRVSPRSTRTINIFQQSFAQSPDWNPPWKDATMKWVDWGDLIATRLQKAAHILNGGYIKYFCYGSLAHCSECRKTPPVYYACSSWKGKYVICLGHSFWNDWRKGNRDSMISTLIHEALHIYFSKTVAHSGRSRNVSCYLRFIALINNRRLPARVATRCPASP